MAKSQKILQKFFILLFRNYYLRILLNKLNIALEMDAALSLGVSIISEVPFNPQSTLGMFGCFVKVQTSFARQFLMQMYCMCALQKYTNGERPRVKSIK